MGSKLNLFAWSAFLGSGVLLALIVAIEIVFPGIFPEAISNYVDRGIITKLILAVFVFSLFTNLRNTIFIVLQSFKVRAGYREVPTQSGSRRLTADGLLGVHGERLLTVFRRSNGQAPVSQEFSLGAIRNQLRRREWIVRVRLAYSRQSCNL